MEGLHVAMEDVKADGLINGLKVGNISVSHFISADDVLVLADWSEENLLNIKAVFDCFFLTSGLRLNLIKSKLYGVGVSGSEIDNYARIMGCGRGSFPFIYLGVPIAANMSRLEAWQPVIDKFKKRLSKWKVKLLSIGGRSVFTSSVLGALGNYYMSLFRMPANVNKKLEMIRAKFFWGDSEDSKKMHWIKWDSVLASKDHGGLGFGSLDALNRAMLYKWRWRYVSNPNALWVSVINNIYKPICFNDWNLISGTKSGTWCNINKVATQLDSMGIIPISSIALKVGNGSSSLFWFDIWLGNIALSSRYPRLCNLEVNKMALVRDKWRVGRFWSSWRRNLRGGAEECEFNDMVNLLKAAEFGDGPDCWMFSNSSLKEFSVKGVRSLIDNNTLPNNLVVTRWNKLMPRKVNIHAWRLMLDRLPTRCNLVIKGIDIPSLQCPLCNDGLEDNIHVFGSCSIARRVWHSIFKWLQLDIPSLHQPPSLANMVDTFQVPLEKKCIIEAIVFCTWWFIWRYRNEKVFNARMPRDYLVDTIISQSHFWFSNQSKKKSISWVDWLRNPLLFV